MDKAEQPLVKGSGRFDYVKYDEQSISHQENAKAICRNLEAFINLHIQSARAKASALTNLEIVYMWIGKGIRDDQVLRNAGAELQEERGAE